MTSPTQQKKPSKSLLMLGQSGWQAMTKTSLTLPWTDYIGIKPTAKQLAFLLLDCQEAFYGGSAGGGKSVALLAAALQYADVPGYAAIIFRRTFADLSLPEALMDVAKSWLTESNARWKDTEKTWYFPSGATLTFGYLDNADDKYRYQSAQFQYIGFDELTQFHENDYRYLFSRLRRTRLQEVPLRMRSASNPGGVGHEWVKQRFITEGIQSSRPFISARLEDNPHLDQESYIKSLMELDPFTRAQLLAGDWDARVSSGKFRREWFEIVDDIPRGSVAVRYWDMAATAPKKQNKDPDWTVGLKLLKSIDGQYYVGDVRRIRARPLVVEHLAQECAVVDGQYVSIYLEQEPGASGVQATDYYIRKVLPGYVVFADKKTGSKEARANPVSSQAEAGNIKLVRGPWITAFLDELEGFPYGEHDDQVDALSGAFAALARIDVDVDSLIIYNTLEEFEGITPELDFV